MTTRLGRTSVKLLKLFFSVLVISFVADAIRAKHYFFGTNLLTGVLSLGQTAFLALMSQVTAVPLHSGQQYLVKDYPQGYILL